MIFHRDSLTGKGMIKPRLEGGDGGDLVQERVPHGGAGTSQRKGPETEHVSGMFLLKMLCTPGRCDDMRWERDGLFEEVAFQLIVGTDVPGRGNSMCRASETRMNCMCLGSSWKPGGKGRRAPSK